MATTVQWVGFGIGLILVGGTGTTVIRTLVVPRGTSAKLSNAVGRGVNSLFMVIVNRLDEYESKDRVLIYEAPIVLLLVLILWLLMFILGYSLMMWPFLVSFPEALRQTGSSLFTLGFAAVAIPGPTVVYFMAAFTGLIVVALQIAYLPSLYSSFNRRETLVTMLQSRAGAPAWGPELLARHQLVGILDNLPDLYKEWERWAADVAESHTNYPTLIWFRSPHPLRSWVVALLAVLDSAALYQSLNPNSAPSEARLCIRMGFTCMREIASALQIPYDSDPFPDADVNLTYEEFLGGITRLEESGFPMERTPEEAWPHFKGWRVNYESIVYTVADQVMAAPGPWSGPRHHLPGMMIVPQRPADRRPDDDFSARPKIERAGWHA
ncbi:MAG: hypothetical protein H0U16_00570 [Actinobacteria bacterium]|nr:hypothetical protein [Actinomycetota bacterium]